MPAAAAAAGASVPVLKAYDLAGPRKPTRCEGQGKVDSNARGMAVCGEALIDMLPRKTAAGEAAWLPKVGGSPFNCCLAANRLGIPVTYVGGLSTDMFGEVIYDFLHGEGVNLSVCPRFPQNPTTLAFVSKGANGEKYAFFKENSADRSVTKNHVAVGMSSGKFRAVHVSLGAVTLEDEKMVETFNEFYRLAREQGSLRSFDPNIRDTMITEKPAVYAKRIESMLASVDLVKMSDEDFYFLYGKDADMTKIAQKLLKLGPGLVVFTMGGDGAVGFVMVDGAVQKIHMPLPKECAGKKTINFEGQWVPFADSVGAGDSFSGGLIAGCVGSPETSLLPQLVERKPFGSREVNLVSDVLKLSATVAAMNCSQVGCNPPPLSAVKKHTLHSQFQYLKI